MTGRKDQNPEERYGTMRNVGLGVMIPGLLFGSVLIGCGIGFYLDKWLGTKWIFTVAGLILGSVAGVREMLKVLKKMQSEKKK